MKYLVFGVISFDKCKFSVTHFTNCRTFPSSQDVFVLVSFPSPHPLYHPALQAATDLLLVLCILEVKCTEIWLSSPS